MLARYPNVLDQLFIEFGELSRDITSAQNSAFNSVALDERPLTVVIPF